MHASKRVYPHPSPPDSNWWSWQRYLEHDLQPGAYVSPHAAVNLLRRYVVRCADDNGPPADVIKAACQCLGIELRTDRVDVARSSGRFWIQRTDDAGEERPCIALGPARGGRRRFVLAHEIGHAVLYSILKQSKTDKTYKMLYGNELQRERFCNQFAADLMIPASKRKEITLEMAQVAMYPSDEYQAKLILERGGPKLTFYHIRTLSRLYRVSIRCMITTLHRHRLLEGAATGIAVMKYATNRFTGLESGLRVWQVACPAWGYVRANMRAARQGFLGAKSAHAELQSNQSATSEEVLVVETHKKGEKGGWVSSTLKTTCAYTAIDVDDEGRYLIALWKWPQP